MNIYSCLQRVLFSFDPEVSHNIGLGALAYASHFKLLTDWLAKKNRSQQNELPTEVMGISFPNPVGLAAGLDKHGTSCNALHALGFGWLELGTVTPLPQPGNSKPRLFRLRQHDAMINRMGFNSVGLAQFLKNIAHCDAHIIKGINIAKNSASTMAHAISDYLACLEAVHAHADYITINISSPNTINLRQLQQADALASLLSALNRKRIALADSCGRRVPLVLKISPDISDDEITSIAKLSRQHNIDGLAATNTTLRRNGVEQHTFAGEHGGLSGVPLAALSTEIIDKFFRNLQGEIPIIGIGGINSTDRALEKFQAGAELIQLYTGFIYDGPKLIGEIIDRLLQEIGEPQEIRGWLDKIQTSFSTSAN